MAELGITAGFLDTLTMNDVEAIEDTVGLPIDDIFAEGAQVPKAKLFKAMAFVVKRRDDPAFTLEDAGLLTLVQIADLIGTPGVVGPIPLPESYA